MINDFNGIILRVAELYVLLKNKYKSYYQKYFSNETPIIYTNFLILLHNQFCDSD